MAPRRWPISTTRSSCLPATPLKNNSSLRNSLPFADTRDFEEQTRGYIAAPASKQIMAEAWHVAWDMAKYEFLLRRQDVDSIHPSRQRQAILNMNYCLYKVIPGTYQVLHADQVQLPTARGC